MKTSTTVSSPLIPISTGIATGAVTLAAAATCPALVPLALLSVFVFRGWARRAIACDVDLVARRKADDIAEEWKSTRLPGERGISVSSTLYTRGALFDLPMTRTYQYELDKED